MNADDAGAEDEDDDTHIPESSKEAFRTAQDLWKSGVPTDTYQRPADSNVSQEALEKAIAAAKMSQKNEGSGEGSSNHEKKPTLKKEKSSSAKDVRAWYKQKQHLKD